MPQEKLRRESAEARAPQVGLHVVSRDGVELGTVKETTLETFHLDVPRGRDYWLSSALVLPMSSGASAITMDFDADATEDYKLPGPVPAVGNDPVLDDTGDQFRDATERGEKREEMKKGGSTRL